MYSLVLMMALSGSAETPAGLFNHGCSGCHGCSGSCSGSCTGSSCCGGSSCHGSKHGCHGGGLFSRKHGCHGGCHGCNGSSCCGGYAAGCCGGHAAGCTGGCGGAVAPPAKAPEKVVPPEEKKGAAIAAPATLVVTLPADAKLTIDGNATRSTEATRTFVTPALETGKEYSYTLKAEVVRDGQTFSTEQRITVRAGAESRINLTVPVSTASAQ